MIKKTKQILLLSLTSFLLISGCSGGRFGFTKKRSRRLLVPAGVDSTVAVRADSLANNLFVSLNREKRADRLKTVGKSRTSRSDTLWKYLANDLGPDYQVSLDKKSKAIEAFNLGAVNLQQLAQLDQNSPDVKIRMKIERLLLDARKNFEKAVVYNPFDLETRSWLARVYQTLALRFLEKSNHQLAINVLENLVRIEKGEHSLYARLAEAYYATEDWPAAHINFQNAESVMRSAAGLDFTEVGDYIGQASLDTAALFYYIYYQGDAEIKMHDATNGIVDLQRALKYATSARERSDIHSYIEWINWDDGNTRAAEKRDQLIALQNQGEYNKAAVGFMKMILKLRTRRAADEITWRLAVLEFQHLKRKNEGIERLKNVVRLAPKNSAGAPVDTSNQRYFDSYGVMCYNLGLENIRKNRKFAFIYFQQAVAVEWENRAKSYLEIAKMSRNNPQAVIKSCEGALAHPEQLDSREQMQAYQLLVEALKRGGKFNEARRYYAKWIQMRNSSRRASR